MSAETNRTVVRRLYEEIWNNENLAALDELVAAHSADDAPIPGSPADLESIKNHILALRTGFPDWHITVEDTIVMGDRVLTRLTAHGTHMGAFQGIAPTGKQVRATAITIFRIAGGKILVGWVSRASQDLTQQLRTALVQQQAAA